MGSRFGQIISNRLLLRLKKSFSYVFISIFGNVFSHLILKQRGEISKMCQNVLEV